MLFRYGHQLPGHKGSYVRVGAFGGQELDEGGQVIANNQAWKAEMEANLNKNFRIARFVKCCQGGKLQLAFIDGIGVGL